MSTISLLLTRHPQLVSTYPHLSVALPVLNVRKHRQQLTCLCFRFPEPPEFVLKLPAAKFVKQGEPLRLECKVSGTAPLKVIWYKHDTKVTDGAHCTTSFADSVAVLELPTTSFDDDGVYTCEVQNDAGSVSCSTTLSVKGQPLCCDTDCSV